MKLIQQWKEFRQFQNEERSMTLEDILLRAGISTETVTKEQALNIPAVSAAVGLISDTVASLPIILYKEESGKVTEVKDDRVSLLNDDTKDSLDGFQFKKALVEDYLLDGAGYAYINRERNKIKSLHYVSYNNVSVNINADPIFKNYDILVNGTTYSDYEFIKLTRKTKDGVTGKGVIQENNKMLSVAYNSLVFEDILVRTGGNKKGFITSENKLDAEAITALKEAWKNLYKNNSENVVVLNKGLSFQEASNTSVEMELNSNKKTNSIEVCKMFKVPPSLFEGTATDEVHESFIKICINPILKAIETAVNKDLLLPSEKGSFYFAVDTNEILKGNILKRYQAYSEAVKAGWISKNEIRYREDYEAIEGLDIVTMSLGEVIYDTNSKKYFTPNMDSVTNSGMTKQALKGGGNIEN
ncbi:phage portal protein [Cytobacillus firmus]|uniref:Phage portal protein n=1 Tax=Cytobacillus firmus TaxID=1399 RepID=A0A800N9F8_CYTFI|nr:phage portal protein [Cytobacillus firmus]KAF0822519.1 Phage portal protein [Cytobacillus firmus]